MPADASGGVLPGQDRLSRFDIAIPHSARIYDAWLGGKDNFAADRAAAQAATQAFPATVASVRSNRAFLARAVNYLAAEAGILQFLDIGTGLPSANNTHEVAQAISPDARVVYVDNDPVVLAHARALLTSTENGVTDYVEADLRDPAKIIQAASRTLDFTQPVAILLIAVLHFITDEQDPCRIVDALVGAVPVGSCIAISHIASDIFPEEMAEFARIMNQNMSEVVTLRDHACVSGFFSGLELAEPGVVKVSRWRPRSEGEASAPAALWGGIGLKSGHHIA